MMINIKRGMFGVLGLFGLCSQSLGQDYVSRKLSVQELFTLATQNHPNLRVSRKDIEISEQDVKIAKDQYLPDIKVDAQAYYLGDATILDKDFSNVTHVEMPHFGNSLSIKVSELIWKGNVLQKAVKASTLQEELARLSFTNNEQSVKLLALGYYLDLYKLYNQTRVYQLNIDLANQRLVNIKKYYDQGMVTRNDIIRGELQISNLKLAFDALRNNKQILNEQLIMALGMDRSTIIIPDESIISSSKSMVHEGLEDLGIEGDPRIKMAAKVVELNKVSEKITKAERAPALAAFAGNSLVRPITSSSPVLDKYINGWSAGLALTYNLESLYKTPKKLMRNKIQIERSEAQLNEARQMLSVSVKASTVKYNEALSQNKTLEKNMELAGENYRIIESKYNNQLAIILDIIDASNAKLDAELQFANSEINIVYTYYKLLRETGRI